MAELEKILRKLTNLEKLYIELNVFFHQGLDEGVQGMFAEKDFSCTDLKNVEFPEACLMGADISESDCSGASFWGADLSGANLVRSDFTGADFGEADLEGVDLTGADLSKANLVGTNLADVKFDFDISEGLLIMNIATLSHTLYLGKNHVRVGCETKSREEWENVSEEEAMEGWGVDSEDYRLYMTLIHGIPTSLIKPYPSDRE